MKWSLPLFLSFCYLIEQILVLIKYDRFAAQVFENAQKNRSPTPPRVGGNSPDMGPDPRLSALSPDDLGPTETDTIMSTVSEEEVTERVLFCFYPWGFELGT